MSLVIHVCGACGKKATIPLRYYIFLLQTRNGIDFCKKRFKTIAKREMRYTL